MQQSIQLHSIQSLTRKAQKLTPKNFSHKTGQVIRLLQNNPTGLTHEEIQFFFYENLASASWTRRNSARMSIEKVIQRARQKFAPFHITIKFNQKTKRYSLDCL